MSESTPEKGQLGAVFGTRTKGLAGGLPPRPRPAAPPSAEPKDEPETARATASAEPSTTTTDQDSGPDAPRVPAAGRTQRRSGGRPPRSQEPTPPEDADAGAKNRPVYVRTEVRDALNRKRREVGSTVTDVVFDAIEATYEQLPRLIADSTIPAGQKSLFERSTRRTRSDEPVNRVQVTLRLSPQNEQVLDTVQTECKAASRSHLVETALAAFLLPSQ